MSSAIYNSNADIPKEMLLGNLLFMNIKDMKLSEKELYDEFAAAGLPSSYINKIKPSDVFRRATSSIKGKSCISAKSGVRSVINIDEVCNDDDKIIRIASLHEIDEKNEDIEFEKMLSFKFDRHTKGIQYTISSQNLSNDATQIAQEVGARFNEWCIYHNKDTIRNLINRIVRSMRPINLMPTGICKFIPLNSSDTLYKLNKLISSMSSYCIRSGDENLVEIIPIIDTKDQRDLITKNYSLEITEEMNDLASALSKVISKGSLTSKQASTYINKFAELKQKADEYDDMLGIYSENIQKQIKISLDLINDNADE